MTLFRSSNRCPPAPRLALSAALGVGRYDFARSYLDAGGFTMRMRIYQAGVYVVQWYSVAFAIIATLVLAIAFGTNQVLAL